MNWLRLRPFQTSTTFHNLKRQRAGVFHVVDDVLLLARAAIGPIGATLIVPSSFRLVTMPSRIIWEFRLEAAEVACAARRPMGSFAAIGRRLGASAHLAGAGLGMCCGFEGS